jgi:hypothetical protein
MNNYGGSPQGAMSPQDKQALMVNIKQQLDVAHAQELLMTINEKCFKMCVQKPSSSLSGSDQVNFFSTSYSFVLLFKKFKILLITFI